MRLHELDGHERWLHRIERAPKYRTGARVENPYGYCDHGPNGMTCPSESPARRPPRTDAARARPYSAGLPQLHPIALRIGDPAESTDTLHVLSLVGHVRSLGA
ncbi:hypothetical protein GCM10023322_61550 [Rugosimonospora acidiphila]|uniref:Uncharacterized protein n=1 Tax=Rugosimonospora acidiphila TaxID=556531 RepID=A0ABP9SF85_9ACTN